MKGKTSEGKQLKMYKRKEKGWNLFLLIKKPNGNSAAKKKFLIPI